ncbi:MAG: tetratricopeptide repeat protein [Chloroherpetonaceae bacterium]|nr:tetratricopeptide repeat protein [Chloroherpetonaceae bacterium]
MHVQINRNTVVEMKDRISELEHRLKDAEGTFSDIEKIDILNELAWEYRNVKPQYALELSKETLRLSNFFNYQRGLAYAMRSLATSMHSLGQYDEALEKSSEAANLLEMIEDYEGQGEALNVMGNAFLNLGQYADALEIYSRVILLFQQLGKIDGEARALNNIGVVYGDLGDYSNAIDYHFKSLELSRKCEDSYLESVSFLNLGYTNKLLGDYNTALTHYLKSLELKEKVGDKIGIASVLNGLADIYSALGNYQPAIETYLKALKISEEYENKTGIASAISGLGETHLKSGEMEKAVYYFTHAVEITTKLGDLILRTNALLGLGRLLLSQERFDEALAQFNAAEALSEKTQSLDSIMRISQNLAECYEKKRDYEKALRYFRKFHNAEKETFTQESRQKVKMQSISFQLEQSQRNSEFERSRNEELQNAYRELHTLHETLEAADKLKAQLVQQLEKQAREDGLTNLYNRRHLDLLLTQEFSRTNRHNRNLTLAICDIDHFKKINDRFSHQIGDEVIRTVASIFKETCRAGDLVGRYGGEEFVIIFPETPPDKAAVACEKIRVAIESYEWRKIHPELKVTISVGLCGDTTVPNHEKMLSIADAKLYQAKNSGRNQVIP